MAFLLVRVLIVPAFWGLNIVIPGIFISFFNICFVPLLNFKIFREIRRLERNPVIGNQADKTRKARERKTARTVGLIVAALFCCYVPLVAVAFLRQLISSSYVGSVWDAISWVTITIAMSNSSMNCFIYFWKNTEIRVAILKVLRAVTQRFRSNEVSP